MLSALLQVRAHKEDAIRHRLLFGFFLSAIQKAQSEVELKKGGKEKTLRYWKSGLWTLNMARLSIQNLKQQEKKIF